MLQARRAAAPTTRPARPPRPAPPANPAPTRPSRRPDSRTVPIEIRTPEESEVPALFAADGRGFGVTYEPGRGRPPSAGHGPVAVPDRGGGRGHRRHRRVVHARPDRARRRRAADGWGHLGLGRGDPPPPGPAAPAADRGPRRHRRAGGAGRRARPRRRAASTAASATAWRASCAGCRSTRRRRSCATRWRPSRGTCGSSSADGGPQPSCRSCGIGAAPRRRARRAAARQWWDMVFADQSKGVDGFSAAFRLGHEDGYATYRIRTRWNEGAPAHELELLELCAATAEAHRRAVAHAPRDRPGRIDQVPPVGAARRRAAPPAREPSGGAHRGPRRQPLAAPPPPRRAARRAHLRHRGSPRASR